MKQLRRSRSKAPYKPLPKLLVAAIHIVLSHRTPLVVRDVFHLQRMAKPEQGTMKALPESYWCMHIWWQSAIYVQVLKLPAPEAQDSECTGVSGRAGVKNLKLLKKAKKLCLKRSSTLWCTLWYIKVGDWPKIDPLKDSTYLHILHPHPHPWHPHPHPWQWPKKFLPSKRLSTLCCTFWYSKHSDWSMASYRRWKMTDFFFDFFLHLSFLPISPPLSNESNRLCVRR